MNQCCEKCVGGGIPRLGISHCMYLGDCPCHLPAPAKEGEAKPPTYEGAVMSEQTTGPMNTYAAKRHRIDFINSLAKEGGWAEEFDTKWRLAAGSSIEKDDIKSFIHQVEEQAYQRGLVDMKAAAIEALDHMTIEVVGNSAKTLGQAVSVLQALDVTKKTI